MSLEKWRQIFAELHEAEQQLRYAQEESKDYVANEQVGEKDVLKKVGNSVVKIWGRMEYCFHKGTFSQESIDTLLKKISHTALQVACSLEDYNISSSEAKVIFGLHDVANAKCIRRFEITEILNWPDKGIVLGMKRQLKTLIH